MKKESAARMFLAIIAALFALIMVSCEESKPIPCRVIGKSFTPAHMSNEPAHAQWATHMTPRVIIVPHTNPPPPPTKISERYEIYVASVVTMDIYSFQVTANDYPKYIVGSKIYYKP